MLSHIGRKIWLACLASLFLTASVHAADTGEWQLTTATDQGLPAVVADSTEGILLTAGSCDCAADNCGDGVDCGCNVCKKNKKAKANPCATSHKTLFYANDFSYLNDPCYKGCCLGDSFKQLSVGQCGRWGTLDVGGQLRLRYHHEIGMGQTAGLGRFQDTEHDIFLTRLRLYTNWKVNDYIRFYGEGILADVTDDSDTYLPRGIDRNYGDFLNLFVDLKLTDRTTVRIGRQELLYGAQRAVSPLDWANTRRTFEGVKVMWQGDDWAVDGFYTNYVPVDPFEMDKADYNRSFYGVYGTYRGWENASMDAYYLGYDNQNPAGAAPGSGDFSVHTLGVRLNGSINGWLWEVEGGPQFGRQSGLARDHSAFSGTTGLGRQLADNSWKPTLWFYYDYATGDNGSGSFNQYNQLFPLAHKYFGFIDAVQRANVEAPNLLLTMKPTKKISLLAWYWHFMSNESTPVPAIGGTPPQNSGSTLGDELDLIAKYGISSRSNVLIGYSHFWKGSKITAPNDADFTYVQWTTNF